jgi:alkaline phosphatase D
MVGCVTDTSARIWMRTAHESRVSVEAIRAGDPRSTISSQPVLTSADEDYSGIVEIAGLSPDTAYRYHVLADGKNVGPPASFQTYPKVGSSAQFAVAFGGGAGFVPEHERMWDTIASRGPLALLMLGDNVYIDDPAHLWTHQYCYYRRQSRPEWRRLVASTSVYAIYDDHDFGTNDCVPGPEIDTPPWKRAVWRVFRQNWTNPAYGGGQAQPGCWFDFCIGDVHFILIDGRYYRDLKGGSMLGPVQKAWLLKTLERSEATFKVLASDVPWSEGVKPGSRDTWDGFPQEREEIFSFIERHKIAGVLLISADRHRSDIRSNRRPRGYDLYEFESSRLTNRHTHGIVKTPGLIFGYNRKCSFGLLRFDTTIADPRVTLEIIDIDGQSVYSMDLALSQLSP